MKKYLLNKAIAIAKRNKLVQSLFEKPIDITKLQKKGKFIDGFKNEHILYEGYRDLIRPNWRNVLKIDKSVVGSNIDFKKKTDEGKLQGERYLSLIKTYKDEIKQLTLLELGCHMGPVCYSFAEFGFKKVIGSDYSGYKKDSTKNSLLVKEINEQLTHSRNEIAAFYNDDVKNRVSFVDDDITNSKLGDESFDVIISFDVLEHLKNPIEAFRNIKKLLKKNGIAIYEYNPFFTLNGGHSLCTLDFPWGHVRLNNDDFEEYIKQIRPEEIDQALAFYNEGINRLTISEVKKYSNDVGLKVEALITYSKEQHVRMLNTNILNQVKSIYPNANIEDLVSPRVVLIQRKE